MAALPGTKLCARAREPRLLSGDFSLDANEKGNGLFGIMRVSAEVTRSLNDGEEVGFLRAISSPDHTPGHFSYFEVRDNTLIAGDCFTTQTSMVVAGVFKWTFPFPALFSWDAELCARSAAKLHQLMPSRLCVGHRKTLMFRKPQWIRRLPWPSAASGCKAS